MPQLGVFVIIIRYVIKLEEEEPKKNSQLPYSKVHQNESVLHCVKETKRSTGLLIELCILVLRCKT